MLFRCLSEVYTQLVVWLAVMQRVCAKNSRDLRSNFVNTSCILLNVYVCFSTCAKNIPVSSTVSVSVSVGRTPSHLDNKLERYL